MPFEIITSLASQEVKPAVRDISAELPLLIAWPS
jgi:hypothetical protein